MFLQVVRLVIAGGLMCGNEALASATVHSNAAQQTAALAPIRQVPSRVLALNANAFLSQSLNQASMHKQRQVCMLQL